MPRIMAPAYRRPLPLVGRFTLERDEEVAGEIDAVRSPRDRPRALQPQHAERHRQAAAALDDADEVGIGRVVVGLGVAPIAVPPRQQPGQRACPSRQIARRDVTREVDRLARQRRQMRLRRRPIMASGVHPRELQRGPGKVDLHVRQLADRVERLAGLQRRDLLYSAAGT